MPLSVFPKFRASSAVLSDKIDAVLRKLAGILNGGISVANLAVGTQFPASAFAEAKGVLAVRLVSSHVGAVGAIAFASCIPPVDCDIIAWSFRAKAPAPTQVWLKVNAAPVALRAPLADTDNLYVLQNPAAVAAGQIVVIEPTGNINFSATVFLRPAHVA
ncbi:MAG TPA: hypothetical protein VIU16_02960 [Gaiellaceae bacterium]